MEARNPNMEGSASSRVDEQEKLLRQNISSALATCGGIKEFVYRTGIPRGTLEKYIAETSTPSFFNAVKIASALGVSLDVLAGSDSRFGVAPTMDTPELPAQIMDFNQPDFITLPVYNDVHASAGPGTVPASEQADGVVAFARRFLVNQGAKPDHCSVIWARGTSMKPTIPDGALLVVDHSQRSVEHGCIYVFNVSDRLLVKRARWRLDGRLELVSDNTDEGYPVETFGADSADQLRVVGRVVYFGRTP